MMSSRFQQATTMQKTLPCNRSQTQTVLMSKAFRMSGIPGRAPQKVELAKHKSNERDGLDRHRNDRIKERLAAQDCQTNAQQKATEGGERWWRGLGR